MSRPHVYQRRSGIVHGVSRRLEEAMVDFLYHSCLQQYLVRLLGILPRWVF